MTDTREADAALDAAAKLGIAEAMKLIQSNGVDLTGDALTLVTHAITLGVTAAIKAAREAEITMTHDGDATGELRV